MSNRPPGERTRRLVHLAFGACAFLVHPLGRWGASALALAALLYNALLAPRLGLDRAYRRPGEGQFRGLVTYPLAVLLLILLTPPTVAAAGWMVLACADPAAAVAGTARPAPRLPWNARKSVAGTLAALAAGFLACAATLHLLGTPRPFPPAACAALAAALVESLPLPIDDNLPLAAAAALALLACLP